MRWFVLPMVLVAACTKEAPVSTDPTVSDSDADPDTDTDTDPERRDLDSDGHDAVATGGDDCDDENASVHPGHADWMNDGVDADCDGADGVVGSLADFDVIISGDTPDQQVGKRVAVCDIDADGFDDVVITAPLSAGWDGRIGIFYGANHASWARSMIFKSADTIIEGTSFLLGNDVKCADVDGDGHLDLVSSRPEFSTEYMAYSDFGVQVFYGEGVPFGPSLTDADDGIELSFASGSENTASNPMTLGDLDGDGAAEIILTMNDGSADMHGDLWIIPGDRYTHSTALETLVSAVLTTDSPDSAGNVRVVSDLDGDGRNDLFVGEPYLDADGDPATREGMVSFLADPASGAVAGQALGSLIGDGGWQYGYDLLVADFDADGVADGAIPAPHDATGGAESGAIVFHSALAGDLTGPRVAAGGLVDGRIYGTDGYAFGYQLLGVGDVDGDGVSDILTVDTGPEDQTTSAYRHNFWLVRGGIRGDVRADDAALMKWTAEHRSLSDEQGPYPSSEGSWGVGDIDGDGRNDWILGAHDHEYSQGRVYIELSTSWGD